MARRQFLRFLYAALRYSTVMFERAWTGYAWAALATLLCTAIAFAMRPRFDLVNIAMVYLIAVVWIALRHARGPAVATAVLSVAVFDYAFVPPRGRFTVDDAQYLLTFAIMVAVALIISRLVHDVQQRAREQADLRVRAETERIRSALLASISHDLRTPLSVMAGAASTLVDAGDRLDAHARNELARSIERQSRELADRVAKVLQMTRIETGAMELERDWTDLHDIVNSVTTRLKARVAEHRVINEVPEDLPLVRVDAALVEQALGNLLENSASHTPRGTVVRLRARVQGDEMIISVEDLSGGVSDADLQRIVQIFDRGTGPQVSGAGLGLAICSAIVRLHGGRTWAERVPAGGTAFRFTLPIEHVPAVPAEMLAS